MERIGTVGWIHKKFAETPLAPYFARIRESYCKDGGWSTPDDDLQDRDDALIISVGEVLAFATFAAGAGESWRGKLVIHAGDNMNVQGRLEN